MHRPLTFFYRCATTVSKYLMSETDAKNRDFSPQTFHSLYTDFCIPQRKTTLIKSVVWGLVQMTT